jgi:hypothetical protein
MAEVTTRLNVRQAEATAWFEFDSQGAEGKIPWQEDPRLDGTEMRIVLLQLPRGDMMRPLGDTQTLCNDSVGGIEP